MTQSGVRRGQPANYYLNVSTSNTTIPNLIERYGDYLERISAQQKMLMVASIADHMASAYSDYPMQSSIEQIDADNLLGDALKYLLVEIAEESDASDLNRLLMAIVAMHSDDIRNGAYD